MNEKTHLAAGGAPLGAIMNGRVYADRIDSTDFNCEAGSLALCSDWQEFKRCFDALATWAQEQPAASEVGIQTSEPRAWAHFVKNGNIRIWTSAAKEAVRIAKETGIELTPLYTEPKPTASAEPPMFGDEDHVSVPRGLIGAACSVIDKQRKSQKILDELRRYTIGDLSQRLATSTEPVARIFTEENRTHLVEWGDGVRDLPDGEHALYTEPQPDRVAALTAEVERLRAALFRLMTSDPDGAIANATDAELRFAVNDERADPVVREQAAALLQARAALSGKEAQS